MKNNKQQKACSNCCIVGKECKDCKDMSNWEFEDECEEKYSNYKYPKQPKQDNKQQGVCMTEGDFKIRDDIDNMMLQHVKEGKQHFTQVFMFKLFEKYDIKPKQPVKQSEARDEQDIPKTYYCKMKGENLCGWLNQYKDCLNQGFCDKKEMGE